MRSVRPRTLRALVEQYRLTRHIRPATVAQLHYTVRSLEKHLGREPTTADLVDDTVNRWLAAASETRLSLHTVRSKRRQLLTLWRAAVELGLARPPGRIRPVKAPPLVPTAWSREELGQLLDAAARKTGPLKRFRPSKRD